MCDTQPYPMTPEAQHMLGLTGVVHGPPLTWGALLPMDPYDADPHPSQEWVPGGWDGDEHVWVQVPCGKYRSGTQVMCGAHQALACREYPQGWAGYPGDICPHGKYTGGSGADLMCHQCEMGDDYEPPEVWLVHVLVAVADEGQVCDGCHEAPGEAGARAVAAALDTVYAQSGVDGLVFYIEPDNGGEGQWLPPRRKEHA